MLHSLLIISLFPLPPHLSRPNFFLVPVNLPEDPIPFRTLPVSSHFISHNKRQASHQPTQPEAHPRSSRRSSSTTKAGRRRKHRFARRRSRPCPRTRCIHRLDSSRT
ncbi:hypothetical protein GQ43DRAFT_56937 [Delitschia confertaspora ATCC 74209]|uniref:Uncharacterized protein n=1 Tax=Delitschia confertaspora ATCC 74209 TaxID=1513339 RepID=A0A9P4JM90_9PLEO|nr:hypothetical protein GQ43DRAFT_56937 [Delitschia confertaspora ATCC 74209]